MLSTPLYNSPPGAKTTYHENVYIASFKTHDYLQIKPNKKKYYQVECEIQFLQQVFPKENLNPNLFNSKVQSRASAFIK